jgi:hypothetical protein
LNSSPTSALVPLSSPLASEFLALATPNSAQLWIVGTPACCKGEGDNDHRLSTHRDHLPPQPVPTGSQSPVWVWSPRATGVYTAEFSLTPPPHGGSGGGVSSLLSLLAFRDPPNQAHMVPPNPSAFQRKFTPYVSDSFTLQLAMGGQRAGRLASKPPTPMGGWRACVRFRDREELKPSHFSLGVAAVLQARSHGSSCGRGDRMPQVAPPTDLYSRRASGLQGPVSKAGEAPGMAAAYSSHSHPDPP